MDKTWKNGLHQAYNRVTGMGHQRTNAFAQLTKVGTLPQSARVFCYIILFSLIAYQ